MYCGNLDFNEEDLKLIDGFSQANFKYNGQICLQIIGPDASVYAGRFYNLFINIPTNYPNEPPTAYFGNSMYHVNVHNDTNQILFYRISKDYWRREMRLFQFLIEIFRILVEPDDSKNFFPKNKQNVGIYELYKHDRPTYHSIARTTIEAQPKHSPKNEDPFLDNIDLQYQFAFE